MKLTVNRVCVCVLFLSLFTSSRFLFLSIAYRRRRQVCVFLFNRLLCTLRTVLFSFVFQLYFNDSFKGRLTSIFDATTDKHCEATRHHPSLLDVPEWKYYQTKMCVYGIASILATIFQLSGLCSLFASVHYFEQVYVSRWS